MYYTLMLSNPKMWKYKIVEQIINCLFYKWYLLLKTDLPQDFPPSEQLIA